jgi:hypothetical protein
MRSVFKLAALLLVLVAGASAQNQYYVAATGGSDSNSGTSLGSPWATCTKAMASSGGAVVGASGAVINFIASSSTHAACPSINRGGTSNTARLAFVCTAKYTAGTHCKIPSHFLITSANFVHIGALPQFGFEYTNPNDDVGVDVGWQCGTATTCSSGNGIRVFGNYLHDIAQNASGPQGVGCPQAGAILAPTGHNHAITGFQAIGNLIDHYGVFPNNFCADAHGIYVASGGGVIQNNVVTRAAAASLQYYDQACNATISNNTFANSRDGLIHYGSNGCTPGLNSVTNNIIVNITNVAIVTGFSGANDCTVSPLRQALFSNNDLFANATDFNQAQASCEIRQNAKSENPTTTFVNYTGDASGDYHLKAGSVAVGGGTNAFVSGGLNPCTPTTDIEGTARSAIDIGAFEFGGGGGGVAIASLSPNPASFLATPIGSCSTPQAITLFNTGTASLTQNANSSITPNQIDFRFDFSPPGTCVNGTLAPGQTCTTNVKFCPSSMGAKAAQFSAFTTAGNPSVPITGTATAPVPPAGLTITVQ